MGTWSNPTLAEALEFVPCAWEVQPHIPSGPQLPGSSCSEQCGDGDEVVGTGTD